MTATSFCSSLGSQALYFQGPNTSQNEEFIVIVKAPRRRANTGAAVRRPHEAGRRAAQGRPGEAGADAGLGPARHPADAGTRPVLVGSSLARRAGR